MSSGKTYSLSGLRAEPWTEEAVLAVAARPLGEELPAPLAVLPALGRRLELVAGPEDGTLGGGVEAVGVEHGALVVVAQQHHLALHDEIDALAGVGAVADHVAETVNLRDVVAVDVFEDRLEGLKVTVDVADNGLHEAPPGGCRAAPRAAPPPAVREAAAR
jgi:hypothetical protein